MIPTPDPSPAASPQLTLLASFVLGGFRRTVDLYDPEGLILAIQEGLDQSPVGEIMIRRRSEGHERDALIAQTYRQAREHAERLRKDERVTADDLAIQHRSPAASPGVDPLIGFYRYEGEGLDGFGLYRCIVCGGGWTAKHGLYHHEPCPVSQLGGLLAAEHQQHTAQLAELRRWKDAVTDALVVDWCLNEETANDPRKAIADLIAWNIKIHDDPAVSKSAYERQQEVASLTQQLQTIGAACGFPIVNDHQQLAETICKAIRRRDTELAEAQTQIATLRAALRQADEWIQLGQACRSEAEFTQWMHDVQAKRPAASLTGGSSRERRSVRTYPG